MLFQIEKQAGKYRAGIIETAHGRILTPVFMPVGTQGTVKALDSGDIAKTGAAVILANTYHLYLRPGVKVINVFGGLHKFMRWDKPILTDSGGYQVSSLGLFKEVGATKLTKVTEDGVYFSSHIDGSKHFMTPTSAIIIQQNLGSDIMMAFDEATPQTGRGYAKEAMARTHRWLDLSIKQWRRGEDKQKALFGIIQGGNYRDLRRISAEYVLSRPMSGLALGGATIGQNIDQTAENAAYVTDLLEKDGRPIYFMGVGVSPSHAVGAVLSGADMFDCVAPTKLARCGLLYSGELKIGKRLEESKFRSDFPKERINIDKKVFASDKHPIDDKCDCSTCIAGYSRGYLHHLFKARELLYYRLATVHNVRVMVRVVEKMRQAILEASD